MRGCAHQAECVFQKTTVEKWSDARKRGRCIDKHLVCNGDNDCGSFSDEDECEGDTGVRDDKCNGLFPVPGATRATQGYNALTGSYVSNTLDPEYYGGPCEYVYNGEWRKLTYDAYCENLYYSDDEKYYRKPYNFLSYRFMAQAQSDGSIEQYNDAVSLLRAKQTEKSSKFGVTLGISFLEAGVSGSQESKALTNLTQHTSEGLQFVRLVSTVQTAQFKMRSSDLMLHDEFYQSLMDLPEQYDFGSYARFINQYGTHYITQGTMGGQLEYILVVNKKKMGESNINAREAGGCFGVSLGLSISDVKLTGKLDSCKKSATFDGSNTESDSYIYDKIAIVEGGNPAGTSGAQDINNAESFRKWGVSLKYNPVIIDFEMLPIYELVRMSTVAEVAGTRLPNLKTAWEEYLHEFSSCRCAPCKHGGIPVLSQTACKCLCKEGFYGLACEETARQVSSDGAWSCWGSWSSCVSGKKTRQRQCNNPAPENNGVPCQGSSEQTQHC
ncbi:complement component C8 alpha chain isoform X2 [Chanos chanos]|uniref:Complement component C8 alpha chain isoform X2 n=1 Tax=Chanos chanos TaxID=29144 RepID=A0A6J2VIA6_CHACN|nr:complement component C8 alpha chain isoform X2 [Chanos chanos]